MVADTPFEYDWRHSQPGYGAGRFPAEELRRVGQDEKFGPDRPIVWQARIGPAAVVDTVVAAAGDPVAVTPPEDWPFKRIRIDDRVFDVPDVLVREG